MNAVGWFDIYVDDLDRAVGFYEAMLDTKLEPMPDPSGEMQMMSFPTEMTALSLIHISEPTRPY